MVDVIAPVIAGLALAVAAVSALYSKRSAGASARSAAASEISANAARAQDRRARTPDITFEREGQPTDKETTVIFSLRCKAPEDLDSVVVHRPRTEDRITYPVARVGEEWAETADLGALALGQKGRFILSLGSADVLPEFWVRVTCRVGDDEWNITKRLPVGRPGWLTVSD